MRKSIYLVLTIFVLATQQGITQYYTPIEDTIINDYTAIETIFCYDDNDVDSVRVAMVDNFDVGDTVMIYCVQGSGVVVSGTHEDYPIIGADSVPGNTGRYAFLIINEIDVPSRVVVFNNTIRPDILPMGPGEVAQLIRVPSYRNAEVSSKGLTAPPWDGNTGGVVTMFVHVLKLSGHINVNGKGFRGAQEDEDFLGDCSSTDLVAYDSMFYYNHVVLAGKKGEGITDTTFNRLRGRASNINGGGGGNGLYSGGGGGSNYRPGGSGGKESDQCAPGVVAPGGTGGYGFREAGYYTPKDDRFYFYDRLFFGGGGGTGTEKPGFPNTNGANGGGLVVIVADSIIGGGYSIKAEGADVTENAMGAAGGGGGGGCIVLDVNGYRTVLNLSTVGGDGGNTIDPDSTGPGGGGGGGVYWIADDFTVHSDLQTDNGNGLAGKYLSTNSYGATNGGSTGEQGELVVPIRGFIFNPVPTEFTVCSDMVPDPLLASEPKGGGGAGTYDYMWVDSSSTQNEWLEAPGGLGVVDQQNYVFPARLTDTTYFRRIVFDTDGVLLPDTSFRVAVYVHPELFNNTISAPDTVCSGNMADLFVPTALIGGGPTGPGDYSYTWRKSEEGGPGYVNAEGANSDSTYQTPGLTITTDFRRIVQSGVCLDTSNALKVQVWENHTDYQITNNDTVCYDTELPDLLSSLTGLPPGEGDQNDIRYQWITSANSTDWSDIVTATAETYQPVAQTENVYFARIVLSGSEDACVDTSMFVEILNIPEINNNIISETQTVCTGIQAAELTGTDPEGGVPLTYSYSWEARTEVTGWTPVTDTSFVLISYDPGIMNGDTTWYRRVVGSGGVARTVCISYSDTDTVHVLPSITNNVIMTADDRFCQDDLLGDLVQDQTNGATPGGGATQGGNDPTRIYQWELTSGYGDPDWQITGTNAISYEENPQLSDSLDQFYRRIVFSGSEQECADTTETLFITVHTEIVANTIEPYDSVCFEDNKRLTGITPQGEPGVDPVYTWRDLDADIDIPDSDQEEYFTDEYTSLDYYHYHRVVNIGECRDTSNVMQITVMQLPGGRLTDAAFEACEQDTALYIDLNVDQLEKYILPWKVHLKNGRETGIYAGEISEDGTVKITLSTEADNEALNYEIESISYASAQGRYTCISTSVSDSITGEVPILVYRKPDPQIRIDGEALESFKVCNTIVELEFFADLGTATWSSDPAEYMTISNVGGEAYEASIPNESAAYDLKQYTLTFTSTTADCAGHDSIELYYFEQPADAYAGEDTLLFLINSVQLKADPPTAGIGTWTVEKGSAIIEDEHAHNTFARELGMDEPNEFTWTIVNGEEPGRCVTSSDVTIVLRTEVKRYKGFSPNKDMENEYYIMQGLKYADEFSIVFFNSLGNTVRTITDKNIGELDVDEGLINNGLREDESVVWDGLSENGNLVAQGTYYYVVKYIFSDDIYEYSDYIVVLHD